MPCFLVLRSCCLTSVSSKLITVYPPSTCTPFWRSNQARQLSKQKLEIIIILSSFDGRNGARNQLFPTNDGNSTSIPYYSNSLVSQEKSFINFVNWLCYFSCFFFQGGRRE
mmetsp:Transcript_24126/g.39390  ORF Transcript_24126/g.39390 Transcript_24126/m.39390 type:complete len:111 (+) Transcript_24126:126-458(+)